MSSSISSSERERPVVRRLLRAAVVTMIAPLGAMAVFGGFAGEEIVKAGRQEMKVLHLFQRMMSREWKEKLPRVLFLGDSTFKRSYPGIVAQQLTGEIEARAFWAPGLGPYHHYAALSRAIELEPEAVVLIAHLRVMYADPPLRDAELLLAIPPRELPRAVTLPFNAQGIGVGQIVVGSLANALLPVEAFDVAAGGIVVAGRSPALRWLVPARWLNPESGLLMLIRRQRFAGYAKPIEPGDAALEVLGACVELATRHGARALVIASPIPVEEMRALGSYDDAVFAQRMAVMQAVVETNGGEFLDFHDLLGKPQFRDDLGHYAGTGAMLIAAHVLRWVREALDLPIPQPSPGRSDGKG